MICRSCLRARIAVQSTLSRPQTNAKLLPRATLSTTSQTVTRSNFFPVSPHISIFQRSLFSGHSRRYSIESSAGASAPAGSASGHAPASPEKPDFLDDAESVIWDRLIAEFSPKELVVRDISGGCGSMYGIEISSEKFRGANMLKQQRMVNAVLGDLMKDWHGVQLKTRVP